MKYALIVPPLELRLIEEVDAGYHFVLAQYCNDKIYRRFYQRMHQQGHFIMMDNGAAELGASINIESVVDAADAVGADEIVMPDVLDDWVQTLDRTLAAVEFVPMKQRAMVPQATNWADWENCANQMVHMGCVTICVAKRYENLPGGRSHALEIIMNRGWHLTHNIHLLGCYRNPLAEIARAYKTMPSVRGVDTGAAIAYAQKGVALNSPNHCSLSWSDDFDLGLARRNINLYFNAHKEYNAYNTQK